MRRRVTTIIAAVAVLVPASLAVVAPARALVVGIADQQARTFGDARLTALPVHDARLSVAWDALEYGWQRTQIDAWMSATKAAGMTVLVTFGRSRTRPYSLPPTREYRRQVLAFMRRYPTVREYSPWNEPNLAVKPVNSNPRRISTYYRTLRGLCSKCTVLGAEVVDDSRMATWMRAYLKAFAPGRAPRLWGLHNYVDVNSTSRWGTQTMLRLAPGQIWITETGAILRRRTPSAARAHEWRIAIRTGAKWSALATNRAFTLARSSPRIARIYIYHWRADPHDVWDSGLLAANGTPRPAFDVFARQARLAARPKAMAVAAQG